MRRNAYNTSNDLARSFSALSRAMLGNASDDAAIALAQYRDAQTEGQNLKNRGMSGNLDAIDAATQGNILRKGVANAFGYDLNNGNMIQPVLPGNPQMSVPAFGADQRNMDSGATLTELGNIARTIYGDGTSNANQLSQMLNNLGSAGANRLAESMILRGTDDQAGRGALLMSPSGGKFQNPSFAGQELATNDATNRRDDDLNRDTRLDSNERVENVGLDKNRRVENVGMDKNTKDRAAAGELTDAKERWNNYKADREEEADNYKVNTQAGVDRDKNKAADATVRYKHDNRTVEFTIEPGKLLVIDPVSAKKAGIPIQTEGEYEGLYILDGGEKPGDVQVTVGKGDVHISEFMANKLGIEPNADGQYIIPGAGYNSGSSTSGSSGSVDFAVSPSDDTALRNFIDEQDTENVIDGMSNSLTIVNQLVNASVSAMGAKKSIPKAKAFITKQLGQGFTEFEVPNTGIAGRFVDKFKVPNYILNNLRQKMRKELRLDNNANLSQAFNRLNDTQKDYFQGVFSSLGYDDLQFSLITEKL